MSWESEQPRAVMRAASERRRRERDAAMDPDSGAIKLVKAADRINSQWRRPVVQEPPREALLNRQETLLLEIRELLAEIRDAIKGQKTKRGKR